MNHIIFIFFFFYSKKYSKQLDFENLSSKGKQYEIVSRFIGIEGMVGFSKSRISVFLNGLHIGHRRDVKRDGVNLLPLVRENITNESVDKMRQFNQVTSWPAQ